MDLSNATDLLKDRLRQVRERITAACARAGRDPQSVRLIGVTKYTELGWVRVLHELGVEDLGESRPQQLVQRADELPDSIRWHLIGHLQRNKVELVLPRVEWIHSVDSVRLLERIREVAEKNSLRPRVLLEVNVSGEAAKDGFSPAGLRDAWPRIVESTPVEIHGLMTMAPLDADPSATRAVFASLRKLRDELAAMSGGANPLPELSMGMSGDFEIALEEGATMIRLGSTLFEGLPAWNTTGRAV
ncbi:MAG: YggS family pyridoxal phosphate-dependent enzyme [Planctomycetaceae bacterium]|nr:YggS family pyridoxal phosphate-dependent enzyme [Planctomycetaceae bacterium]